MLAAISLLSLVLGAVLAWLAGRFPTHVDKLELGAGVLLICGLALLGSTLPTIL
jgi:hypothetical protein